GGGTVQTKVELARLAVAGGGVLGKQLDALLQVLESGVVRGGVARLVPGAEVELGELEPPIFGHDLGAEVELIEDVKEAVIDIAAGQSGEQLVADAEMDAAPLSLGDQRV